MHSGIFQAIKKELFGKEPICSKNKQKMWSVHTESIAINIFIAITYASVRYTHKRTVPKVRFSDSSKTVKSNPPMLELNKNKKVCEKDAKAGKSGKSVPNTTVNPHKSTAQRTKN